MKNPDELLEALDPEQRQAARALEGPLVVLAGAGTGKTRAMTHRIAYGVATGRFTPNQVLALTFTAKAAGEMRSRLRSLGAPNVQARTFHSAALRQLQYFWPKAVGGGLPELVDHKASLVAEAASRLDLPVDREALRDASSEIEWSKVQMLTPDEYRTSAEKYGRETPGGISPADMAALITAYEDVKSERFRIDFEDVLLLMVGLLREDARIAAEVHKQYRHFVVDEFQDVSKLQFELLRLWLGDRSDLCVVGDASQTIYSFAGASPRYLLEFGSYFPGATKVELIRNYRSTPQIVQLANSVLDKGKVPGRLELISARDGGPMPLFREYDDDPGEAAGVAEEISKEIGTGRRPEDIAVLYRTNGQSEAIENALASRGISYVLRGGERFFTRREVREAMSLLRGAAKSTPPGNLGRTSAEVLSSLGYSETPPEGSGAVRAKWESLQAIVHLAQRMDAASELPRPLDALVTELHERAEHQFAPTIAGVTLASLHAAKGLEWESVYLIGASEGMIPIAYAHTAEEITEERRLLYVGVTRAQTRLTISWARARNPGSRAHRVPARFVTEIRGARSPQRHRSGRTAGPQKRTRVQLHASCKVCAKGLHTHVEQQLGRCLDCPAAVDPGLLEQLEQWRASRAGADTVPQFMVLTDATLSAVAELEPGTLDELAAVPGIGPVKIERYGEELLSTLKKHFGQAGRRARR